MTCRSHFPEFFTSETRLFRALYYKQALEESNHIIVSFNHVKDDIIRFFGIEESKISVCPIPFSNDWYFRDACTTKIELIERYKLPNNFILNPASITRHKNHGTLFQAVKLLKQKGIKFQIVCTGNTEMSNPYFIELLSLVDQLGIVEEVNFIGMVPACDLISLYKSARLVVIPTLYEAGSGPLFEAMYYGSVVICSNVTSLPESIGNTDFVFDPQNPSELAMLMEKGFFDDNFRKKNIVNSRRRIEELNKTEFFNPFYQAFQKAIRSDS